MSDKKDIPLRTQLKQAYELYLAQKENDSLKRTVIDPARDELKVTDARPYLMFTDTDLDLDDKDSVGRD